jgi:hypothetical protein
MISSDTSSGAGIKIGVSSHGEVGMPKSQPAQQAVQESVLDLFLCHNGADKVWVRHLAEQLESETFEGTAEGRKLRVFLDEWDIEPGENVVLRLSDGLQRARYVAVVISPGMVKAPWPALEWTDIVAGDPTNRQRRIIPVFLRDGTEDGGERIELPPPFKALRWLDFRDKAQYKRSYQQLIRKVRDLPPARGRPRNSLASFASPATPISAIEPETPAAPDRIHEVILGNLLPAESFPATRWSAPTTARKAEHVFERVKECPAFELKEERLYAFSDLSARDSVFAPVINAAGIKSDSVQDWRNDPDR